MEKFSAPPRPATNVRAGWQELVSPAHGEAPEALPRSPRRPPHSLGSPQEPLDDFGRWIGSCPLGSLRTVSIPAWEGPSPGPRPGYVPEGTARVSARAGEVAEHMQPVPAREAQLRGPTSSADPEPLSLESWSPTLPAWLQTPTHHKGRQSPDGGQAMHACPGQNPASRRHRVPQNHHLLSLMPLPVSTPFLSWSCPQVQADSTA